MFRRIHRHDPIPRTLLRRRLAWLPDRRLTLPPRHVPPPSFLKCICRHRFKSAGDVWAKSITWFAESFLLGQYISLAKLSRVQQVTWLADWRARHQSFAERRRLRMLFFFPFLLFSFFAWKTCNQRCTARSMKVDDFFTAQRVRYNRCLTDFLSSVFPSAIYDSIIWYSIIIPTSSVERPSPLGGAYNVTFGGQIRWESVLDPRNVKGVRPFASRFVSQLNTALVSSRSICIWCRRLRRVHTNDILFVSYV